MGRRSIKENKSIWQKTREDLGLTREKAGDLIPGFSPERIEKSEAFLDKWGNLAIFLGRFFPFIRTFVPFLAGMGGMKWHNFFIFNIFNQFIPFINSHKF